jgi:hypothetical protein
MSPARRASSGHANPSGVPSAARRRGSRIQAYGILALVPLTIATATGLIALRLRFQPPTVARYVDADDRGDEVAIVAGGHFEIEVHPAGAVQGAVGARGFLLRGDDVRPWDPPFSVSRDGTVQIAGPVDEIFAGVPPGPWEVAVAVGRPELLPTAPNDVLRARRHTDRPGGWHLVVERIRLERVDGGSPDQ